MSHILELRQPVETGDDEGEHIAPPPFEDLKWRIRIADEEYGPYPRSRLIDFLKEGRVQASSLVACGTDTEYHRADCHPELSRVFKGPKKRKLGDPRMETGDDEGPHIAPPPFEGEKWRIRFADEEYGPYPRSRLIDFLKEGRVEASSLVACGTDTDYHRADSHPNLGWVFKGPKKHKLGDPRVEKGDVAGPHIAPPPFESVKWRIRVADKEYGPYSRTRLIDFLKEGRIQAGSFIACGTDTDYHRADCHPNLRWDFKGPKKRKFGDPRLEAGETEVPLSNYFIAARLLSGNDRFERVLREAGKMTRAAGDMWILRSKQTIQQLRTQLAFAVKPHEHFIIVNASKDRLAWYNIGVENDISVRGVWDADDVQ